MCGEEVVIFVHGAKICYLLKNMLVTSAIYEFLSNFLGVI
jgi:hypothetical protein